MMERPENSRKFISEFIELYKNLPCLWHTQSNEYRDRSVKNKAYALLVGKYIEIDETATKKTVKRKINVLRTTYRKVLGKVNQSIQSGATGDDVYKPTLWYFHLFDFLSECETSGAVTSVLDHDYDEIKNEGMDEDDTQYSDSRYDISEPFNFATSTTFNKNMEQQFISSSIQPRAHSTAKKTKLQLSQNQRTKQAMNCPVEFRSFKQEDSFELFGRHVANKLRSLIPQQNVFAQKLINDVIFEAEMESLARGCKVISGSNP